MRSPFTLLLLLVLSSQVFAKQGYYRFPALHNDTLVFTAEGDLWKAPVGVGYAQRLTTHPAEETQAAISNDGSQVAFVANYEGASEVYVMPMLGGLAKRVTYENAGVRLQGWTPSGDILYSRNNGHGSAGNWTLRSIVPSTLVTTDIPLADSVEGVIDSSGNTLYFTQFGLQISGDNALAYNGGARGEIWSFELGSSKEANKLTAKHKGSVRTPMLAKGRIYFISNQSGSDNIWSMKPNGKDQEQHTNYKEWTVRQAKMHQGKISYQLGADIRIFDTSTETSTTQDIKLASDLQQLRAHWDNKPIKYLTSAKQAPANDKVVITARGRVAVASTDGARLVEIATAENSRTRKAMLSIDGKHVYALNDASGEIEIWRYPADGSTEGEQLSKDGNIFRWDIKQSPDGKWLVHDDKNGDLWLLNLETLENSKIHDKEQGIDEITGMTWSPNSNLLAFNSFQVGTTRPRIMLYDINSKRKAFLTSEKYESTSPAFSHDGKWLYFLSNRQFTASPRSPWGDRNLGTVFDRRSQIFALALDKTADFPFQAPNELSSAKEQEKQEKKTADKKAKTDGEASDEEASKEDSSKETSDEKAKEKADKVDWDNLASRLWQVNVPSGNYRNLQVNKDYLYVLDQISEPNSKPVLKAIKIKPASKAKTYLTSVTDYSLSSDGKKMFVRKDGKANDMFIVKAGASFPKSGDNIKVKTSDWKLLIHPQQEWQQIFHDAWLMHRDSLYDENLRGLDWPAIAAKYRPLLSRLTARNELNDIFKQMMGELNVLHSQVGGGDRPTDSAAPTPSYLGARYTVKDGNLSIKQIFQSDVELISRAAPLSKPGVDAQVGDVIVAINGQTLNSEAQLHQLLLNQQGKQVLLELEREGTSLRTIVVPGSSRNDYYQRYRDWVHNNQQKVTNADDKLGYLHMFAMGGGDFADFAREFYAQYKKPGLIIDVRRNRGGNIDSWVIEKLLRRAWSFWQANNGDAGTTNMQQAFRGHLVVLADEYTYSDGETFAAGIKALELGTVIGKQTAGAGVWLSGRNRQSDNGIARVAEYPVFALDGRWITEGTGIAPDVEVNNLPHATFNGKDAQLNAAIKHLQKLIKKKPIKPLKAKPYPKGLKSAEDIID
jgi:tricorn protease